jgi:uncharacterized protein (DUF433 family)
VRKAATGKGIVAETTNEVVCCYDQCENKVSPPYPYEAKPMTAFIESAIIQHPHVECREGVQGGCPVIKGTRFPVTSIVQNYRRGLSVEEILREFPHLNAAQVHDALSYYHDHQGQIDRRLAELTNLAQAMTRHPPTKRPANDTA